VNKIIPISFVVIVLFYANAVFSGYSLKKYRVKSGDTAWSLSRKFNISYNQLLKANPRMNPQKLKAGDKVLIPSKYYNKKNKTVQAKKSYLYSKRNLYWPVRGKVLKRYGRHGQLFSGGIKIRSYGSKVKAGADGRVLFVGPLRGYGLTIMIKHSNGLVSVTSMRSGRTSVKKGDYVKGAGKIAVLNRNRNNKVVYYQLWKQNRLVNPLRYLRKNS